jgi:hypothetical protein
MKDKPIKKTYVNGDHEWRLNGKRHREDGPAYVQSDGYKAWFLNGLYHREDGPAITYENGDHEWWFNGVEYTEEEFGTIMNHRLLFGP